MRSVIFDLDGTLADTSMDLIAAANACFRALGHGDMLDPVADAATAFHGGRAMLKLGFDRLGSDTPDAVDSQYEVFIGHYRDAIDTHTRLYPGVMEAVEVLKSRGFAVGICTNKPSALAEELLKRLAVRDAFASMIGADTLSVRKPAPEPFWEAVDLAGGARDRSCLIGDTVTDRDTARAAGCKCVLVTFGPTGRAVAELEPDALLDDYAALPDLAEALIG